MKIRWNTPWTMLTAANVLFFCVLGFYQSSSAQPREGNVPFPIPEEQRGEMINLLTEVKQLLKEQNALLRSGNLRVVVTVPKKR
jgi:hypothetical protein